jgi:hypothetical protein
MIITNLLAGMVVLSQGYEIPTNTPVFQEYAFHSIFTNAQTLGRKWNLDENLIAINEVTHFEATATISGALVSIIFDDRYVFGSNGGDCIGFTDRNYDSYMISPYVATNADVIREWLLATNTLTMAKARTIAEAAIKAAGIPMNKMQFGAPQKAEQLKGWLNRGDFKWLPYYTFHWESDLGHCYVDVSGLTTNVVRFDYGGPYMRFETLTNSQVFDGYIQMLGLPTNTVFVKRMFTRPPQYETLPPWR